MTVIVMSNVRFSKNKSFIGQENEKKIRRKIMLQILAATSNKHKIEEFRGAFRVLEEKMKIITLDDIPAFPPAEETGVSFEENSMLKAQTASAGK